MKGTQTKVFLFSGIDVYHRTTRSQTQSKLGSIPQATPEEKEGKCTRGLPYGLSHTNFNRDEDIRSSECF